MIITILGSIPFFIDYPFNDLSENSGPSNFWELIVMSAYQAKAMPIGIIMLIVGGVLFYKKNRSMI